MRELPRTLGALRASGYRSHSVKEELRANAVAALRAGRPLFQGLIGYERTVVPQVVNALLAKHDVLLLGLRGQAKTRLARRLVELLDERVPVLAGSELNEDPLRPLTRWARELIAEAGDDAPIAWLEREERYREKLATPDVSMADLIGDLDPIRAANLRAEYSSERALHYGIVPRTNRGIFCLNELPDLAARIQVGLLGILQEREVQIRGFPVRLPLDVAMVFTANPEDYTQRGAIITPLKDRIASQILTHYPATLEHARAITAQEAWDRRGGGPEVHLPEFLRDAVEEVGFAARASDLLDASSGVSARLTISLLECVVSNAERRALLHGAASTVVRPLDFDPALAAVTGKIELVYQGEQEGVSNVARQLLGQGFARTAERCLPAVQGEDGEDDAAVFGPWKPIVDWFGRGGTLELSDRESDAQALERLSAIDGLEAFVRKHAALAEPELELLPAMELAVEALHQAKLLAKEELDRGVRYADMLGGMLGELGGGGKNPPKRKR
ncbi:MAG: sigma 54-interacting transcriptional regulator [Planctomycetes bacterium]|nr:sigma 54-interacting transcriptional regulator [Planctomycetota bacterium]